MTTFRDAVLLFLRRIIGTEKLNEHAKNQGLQLQKILSILEYSVTDPETIRDSPLYQRCARLISLMTPMDVPGQQFVRIGANADGGYVMLDNLSDIKAAYSFGIGTDVSWDLAMAKRGVQVRMYDHTVDSPPEHHPAFHFMKMGVCGISRSSQNLRTLDELLIESRHDKEPRLVLKMDVEGAEWEALDCTSTSTLALFSQIVIEFHQLTDCRNMKHYENMVRVLEKLNISHQSVHVHANVVDSPMWIGDKVLPGQLEVTFVRRSDHRNVFTNCCRTFPTKLDFPWCGAVPELQLGHFD